MKFFRRVVSAIVLGAMFATGLRLSGGSGSPVQHGGWRPLELPPDDLEGRASV